MTQSEGIGESAYNSGWIGSRFHKSVQIMMMRSKIASKITAAKFYSMSLESFSTVSQLKLDQILEIGTIYLIMLLRGGNVTFSSCRSFMRFSRF